QASTITTPMITSLRGFVRPAGQGFGVATTNLAHLRDVIIQRTGLPDLVPGTLNVPLDAPFLVSPDALISPEEYNGTHSIKLQRCLIRGVRAVIMRPHTHELPRPWGHGPAHLELMSHKHLRRHLGLEDNEAIDVDIGGDLEWWSAGL